MPIEFVAQRMATPPDGVFYDFSCASLKNALARLPFYALFIAWLVNRLHWFKNHVRCSKAMNPDSYDAVDGLNMSAIKERNAASRRLQNFLRPVNQRNFILVTVYQQAVENFIAMHRDVQTPILVDRWPLWYRKNFVDSDDERRAAAAANVSEAEGVGRGADPREVTGLDAAGVVKESHEAMIGCAGGAGVGEEEEEARVGDAVSERSVGEVPGGGGALEAGGEVRHGTRVEGEVGNARVEGDAGEADDGGR